MCGIFGLAIKANANHSASFVAKTLKTVARVSLARGQDSSGMVFKHVSNHEFNLIKGDVPITTLLKNREFTSILNKSIVQYQIGEEFQAIGHARLVTNGSQLKAENNQPVVKDGLVGIHNGIIVNDAQLWKANSDLKREYEIDTEILLSLISKNLRHSDLQTAIADAMNVIEGTVSSALLFDDRNEIALFTNNGSLYYILENDFLLFASEAYFLKYVLKKRGLNFHIHQVKAFEGVILNIDSFKLTSFNQKVKSKTDYKPALHAKCQFNYINLKGNFDTEMVIDPMEFINKSKEAHLYKLLENNLESINHLKRCTRCILPETFPFIVFDEKGVCNFCNHHQPKTLFLNFDELKRLVAPYKRNDGKADCIVPFSGGRDSTYSLHVVKNELGLNPIAFTYDWGLVTDLARRNIAKVCGKMGVGNIVVSADIRWKRENIKKNIEAWLKHPNLGMVPLFMAGDKYFFHYCNVVKKQTGIDLNIWGINTLENTNFKTGFAGLDPQYVKKQIYSISAMNKLKLFGFVAKNLMNSPSYINQSVFDSLGSFAVRYIAPKKDYFHLFDYYRWNEEEIESLIKNEYNWEKAIDTDSTWRIGDGTASFYNYIYYTVAGFTENDTFRSNQIREGMISRDIALAKANHENQVRYETMRWYLEIVGLDFATVVNVINRMPKQYPLFDQ
ncbi:MAG: glucosamine 6-phosphate synthetase [Bacteroidota bacterium]